jgi:3-oxoacyl-[acyl-carrier-protein] synthase-3
MMLRSVVVGVGSYLPKRVMTNAELSKIVDTNDEWIRERTGISQRHIAADNEFTSDLATNAAKQALERAELTAADLDAVIVATTTPDLTLPSTASRVQHKLGMKRGWATDVSAACAGFIYAIHLADGLIQSGKLKRIMLIGAETYSRIVDWKDRGTCILFGDGAGAMILEAQPGKGDASDRGVLFSSIHSDGDVFDILYVDGGVSTTPTKHGYIIMEGKEVFRHAVDKMTDATVKCLEGAGLRADQLDLLIPHQANERIMAYISKKLNLKDNQVISTVKDHANTSAASIPLAMSVAFEKGLISKGNIIAMPALGAGLAWGACILRW